MSEPENNLNKYGYVISIWKRWDESYWTSFHMFLIVEGLLLAGYSQVIDIRDITKISNYSIIYSLAGIAITILWLFVLHKKMAFTYLAEDVARELENSVFTDLQKGGPFQRSEYTFHGMGDNKKIDIDWLQGHFGGRWIYTIFPSSTLIAFCIPFLIFEIWVITASIELGKIGNNSFFILFLLVLIMIILVLYLYAYLKELNAESYIWYAGYGSNLSKQRFECYIIDNEERPKYGLKECNGCTNKTLPSENYEYLIPYRLYFALPSGEKTSNWGPGGVAFINPDEEKDKSHWTKGRIWKITREQFEEIKEQEGPTWYSKEITLDEKDGIPIITITNPKKIARIKPPSDRYLKTIIEGLKETYNMESDDIVSYLIEKEGIKNNYTRGQLIKIVESIN